MAKKEKRVDLKELTQDELSKQAEKSREDLYKLRFKSATVPQKNTMEIRILRRQIARLETFINQKRNVKV